MESQIHSGWRRVACLVVVAAAAMAGLWSFLFLPVAPTLVVLVVGSVVAVVFLRRATWRGSEWKQHVAFKRRAARELLRANEGQHWRPPLS